MAVPSQQLATLDLIAGSETDAVGYDGSIRLTRAANGVQLSIDGGPPELLATGGGTTLRLGANLSDGDTIRNPGADQASMAILPAHTLTADGSLALDVSGSPLRGLEFVVV